MNMVLVLAAIGSAWVSGVAFGWAMGKWRTIRQAQRVLRDYADEMALELEVAHRALHEMGRILADPYTSLSPREALEFAHIEAAHMEETND